MNQKDGWEGEEEKRREITDFQKGKQARNQPFSPQVQKTSAKQGFTVSSRDQHLPPFSSWRQLKLVWLIITNEEQIQWYKHWIPSLISCVYSQGSQCAG